MFFCEECRKKRGWPEGFRQSYGPCECCGKVAGCWDVPSHALPMPKEPAKAAKKATKKRPAKKKAKGKKLKGKKR